MISNYIRYPPKNSTDGDTTIQLARSFKQLRVGYAQNAKPHHRQTRVQTVAEVNTTKLEYLEAG